MRKSVDTLDIASMCYIQLRALQNRRDQIGVTLTLSVTPMRRSAGGRLVEGVGRLSADRSGSGWIRKTKTNVIVCHSESVTEVPDRGWVFVCVRLQKQIIMNNENEDAAIAAAAAVALFFMDDDDDDAFQLLLNVANIAAVQWMEMDGDDEVGLGVSVVFGDSLLIVLTWSLIDSSLPLF